MPPGTFTTAFYSDGVYATMKPAYRAQGTYTYNELTGKIANTQKAVSLGIQSFTIPPIEAFGLFRNEELKNEEGPFGFLVQIVPRTSLYHAADACWRAVLDFKETRTINLYRHDALLMQGLQELHHAGFAHLQPHHGNLYFFKDKLLVMDWATLHLIATNQEASRKCRALDIAVPLKSMDSVITAKHKDLKDFKPFLDEYTWWLISNYVRSPDLVDEAIRRAPKKSWLPFVQTCLEFCEAA